MNPKPFQINRRRLLQSSIATASASVVPRWFIELEAAQAMQPKSLAPNGRIGIALVGCGGQGNFFDCVRSHKDPICDVEIGHRSISVAHLGAISVRMNQPLKWNPDREVFTGPNSKEANRWLEREQRKPYDHSFIA